MLENEVNFCSTKNADDYNLESVAQALRKRWFEVSITETLADATALVMKQILPTSNAASVAFGGSATIVDSGLVDLLKEVPGLLVMDTYDRSVGKEAFVEIRRKALFADLFLCSANAITKDGRVVLLDLFGNRTAAVQFGPHKVVLIIGKNKICDDFHAAMSRVRNSAAPQNAQRLERKTPCVKTGICTDCSSSDRICASWTILDRSGVKERIHIILVNEELGF